MGDIATAASRSFNKGVFSVSIVLIMAGNLPAQAQTSTTQGRLLRDEATFQLALTMKVRADQLFLTGDRAAAKELYGKAAAELKDLDAKWSADNDTLLALLDTDIAYRQALLRYDADFWGATYSLTPINPVEAYLRFAENVDRFDELVKRIDTEQKSLSASTALADSWRAAATGASTESGAQALTEVVQEVTVNHHAAKATAAQGRIDSSIERQKKIAEDRGRLAANYDVVHKQFDALVVNAVLQTAGVPPELEQLARSDKPLEQRILAAGRAAFASNSDLANSFSKFSETTASVVGAARSVDKALAEVQSLDRIRKSSEAAVSALRKGTLDGALEAGYIVYGQLPDADKAKLTEYVVDKAKPAMALLDTAHGVKATLEVVVSAVQNEPAMLDNFRNVIAERALDNAPAFDRWYRTQLADAVKAATSVGSAQALAEQAIRGWPRAFVARLPSDFRKELRQALNAASDAEIAAKTFSTWPPAGGVKLDTKGLEIEIRLGPKLATVNVQTFVEAQRKLSLEALEDYAEDADIRGAEAARIAMQQRLSEMVTTAMSAHDDLAKRFIGSAHELDPAAALSRLVPKGADGIPDAKASAQLFDKIWQQMPQQAKEATGIQLAEVQAGSMLAKDIVSSRQRRPPGNPATTGGTDPGKAEEAILKAAVTAAFPAAGAAIMAAEAMNALGQMNSLADEINALTAEDRRIMAEQITLYDLVRDERAAAALADLGIRVAKLRKEGALAQAGRYMKAAQRLDEASIKDIGAQRLYLPQAFLLAELLRFHFDRLDRSLAFWTGDPRAPRGQIARELASDPQWLRYALDPSIQLFNWLNRAGESDRGELQRLAAEWQNKQLIASEVCDKLHCKQNNAVVGEVTASPEISLREAVPDQWKRFVSWKNSGSGGFTFELLLTPALLKPGEKMHNIRYVRARAGVERAGTVQAVQGITLEHSGAAYVPYEDTFVKEHYKPDTAYGIDWSPFGDMSTRWSTTLSLRPLEGYGVYTLWRLVVPDSTEARQADDVKLQFNFQYQKRTPPDDRWLMAEKARKKALSFMVKTADNVPVKVQLSDLPFVGSEDAARKTIASIAAEPDAAKLGLDRIELQEEKGGQQP